MRNLDFPREVPIFSIEIWRHKKYSLMFKCANDVQTQNGFFDFHGTWRQTEQRQRDEHFFNGIWKIFAINIFAILRCL